jgi:hypothetical protein
MSDGLTDSNDLSPTKRGGIGSMAVLLSAMVSIVAGVLFPTTGRSLEPYILVWLGGLLYVNLIPEIWLVLFASQRHLWFSQ